MVRKGEGEEGVGRGRVVGVEGRVRGGGGGV